MKRLTLTPRLQKLADLAAGTEAIWDVGSDHGKLPAWLLSNGLIKFAAASDIRKGPLDSAVKTAKETAVGDRMKFLLCDGLDAPLSNGIDTIIIAGMGGEMIANILERAPWVIENELRLLLQPMSSAEDLREYLYSRPYAVIDEYLVRDRDKLYLIIEAKGGGADFPRGPQPFDLADTRIGKHLIGDGLFEEYAKRELNRLNKEVTGADEIKAAEINEAIRKIEAAISDGHKQNKKQ